MADFRSGLEAAEPIDACPVDARTPAFWCHSSGTSGKPKAVVHAHSFARHIEQVSSEGLGIHADDRLFASSKLFFSYPQTNSLWAGLKLGATVILDPQWPTAASVAATVAAQRPTVLFSVPSLYRNLLHDGFAPGIAQAGVRLCVSAGEALPPSLRDEWQRQTGLVIVNGYGASETLVLVMLDRGDAAGFTPSPGVTIQPLDEVSPGQPSRLCIRVPTLALGYLDRPQAQAENFRDGAFCPADLWRSRPGAPFSTTSLAGRPGPTSGRLALRRARGLAGQDSRPLGQPGRTRRATDGEDPRIDRRRRRARARCRRHGRAWPSSSPPATTRRSAAHCSARANALPAHQRPRWWYAVQTLPRGPTGKLLRRKLRELHGEMG